MDWRRRAWLGIAEVGMAFCGVLVGYLVVGFVFGQLPPGPHELAMVPCMTAVAAVFYGWVAPRWAAATRDEDEDEPRAASLPPRPGVLRAIGIVALGLFAALAGSVVLSLLLEAFGQPVSEQGRVLEIVNDARAGGPQDWAIALAVSALLLAPIAEEWLFRRVLFVRLLGASGRLWAYSLSAFAFAAIHFNPAGFWIYLWLGVVFAAVLDRTGRLWAAIAVHMGNNAYVLAVLFFGVEGGA